MRNLMCLQLLLFSILSKLITELTLGQNWPVSSSNVKLLGFFPQQANEESKNDMWTIHCRSMFRAAIVLSQQYNITFQGEFLTYEEIITNDDLMVTFDHTCQKVSTSNIVGFIGPAYSSEARCLASFAYRLGILSVSYSATSPDLSTIDNGAFYRTIPSDENTALSITILFQQYKWKSCIIIYQNDEYGYDGINLLSQKFSQLNIKTQQTIKYDMNQQNFQIDLRETLVNSFSRIVIIWANENSTITIVNKLLEENLMDSNFVWILTATIGLDYFNQKQKQKLIGIITIEPITGDLIDVQINTTLLNQAYEIWKYYEPDTFPGDKNVSSFALFTFDATWALILSLQQLCSMELSCLEIMNVSNCYNRQFLNSKQYYNIMKTMEFLGVSGKIKFSNETCDRISDVYYIIKNIQPLNNIDYVPVLKWYIGLTEWTYYKNESDQILWPSLSKNIPTDHQLIQGQELRMAIIESPPFIILKNPTAKYSNMTDNYKKINMTEFDGYFKDLILYLQDKMNFIPVIMLAKQDTTYDELVEGVAKDLFNTVMSSIAMTAERSEIVEFSIPIMPSSMKVIIRKPTSIQLDVLFFLKPFSWTLWLFVLIVIIPYSGILIWFYESNNTPERDNGINHNENALVRTNIIYTICIILGRGPFSIVSRTSSRVLTVGLFMLQIILLALYTASLFSFLITQNSNPIISGIDDIKNGKISPSRVGTIVGSQVADFYVNYISQGETDYYQLKSLNEMFTCLLNGDIDAALWTNISTEYYTNNIYCDLMTVGAEVGHNFYQLPVKKDWLYKDDLDFNILSLIDSGELDRISAKWFSQHTCGKTNLYETKTITIQTMSAVFIAFIIISFISILVECWSRIEQIITIFM